MQKEYWMLVKDGKVHREDDVIIPNVVGKVWPIANTEEEALKLIERMKNPEGVTPALIGSVEVETMEGHVRLAVEDGCVAIICPEEWKDGKPVMGFQLLARSKDTK